MRTASTTSPLEVDASAARARLQPSLRRIGRIGPIRRLLLVGALVALSACQARAPAALPLARFGDARGVRIDEARETCPWPTRGRASFALVPSPSAASGVSALAVGYELAGDAPTPVGVRLALDDLDLSAFDHLVFRARSVAGDDPLRGVRAGLRRPHPDDAAIREGGTAPLPALGRAWRTVSLPLTSLIGLDGLHGIDEFVLLVEPLPGASATGAVEIDAITAVRTGQRGRRAWDRPTTPRKREWVARHGGAEAVQAALRQRALALPRGDTSEIAQLPAESAAFLRRLASDTWRGLDGLRDRHSGLPFDTVTIAEPSEKNALHISDYTTVTNIGLYLVAVVAARELGFIDAAGATARAEQILATLEALETHEGFFFNYYDTTSRERSSDFVSFVDSSWLAAALIVLRNAVPEVAPRASALFERSDFAFFYDPNTGLMSHGSFTHLDRLSPYHYGLLYTEARLGSLIAIGKGDVPTQHWYRVQRVLPPACDWQSQLPQSLPAVVEDGVEVERGVYVWRESTFVPSWGGSMFEALMPLLLLDEPHLAPASFGRNAQAHVHIQRTWRDDAGPWGWSPSRTPRGGYREFGVPALGIRGYPDDVIAPYAAALALLVEPAAAAENLRRLAALDGLYGEFGFYDAVEANSGRVARAYLALDQAMTLIALANQLENGVVQEYFAADPVVRAVVPLLARERFFE